MLMPSVFHNDLFDVFERNFPESNKPRVMKTDIKENENGYELDVELPGFSKDEVSLLLEDGYLTIEANKDESKEDKKSEYIRRERYQSSMSRSFYVGDTVNENDITAGFTDGILKVSIPKKKEEAIETKKYIPIG